LLDRPRRVPAGKISSPTVVSWPCGRMFCPRVMVSVKCTRSSPG
jgi:hypothetical protein